MFAFSVFIQYNEAKGSDRLELNIWLILALIGVGAGAAFIQRVSGFGSGIFSMLLLPYLFGNTVTAAAVSGMWSTATTVFNAIRHRNYIDFKLILPIIIPAMLMVTLSVQWSKSVSSGIMMIILGGVLILLSIYFLLFSQKLRLKASLPGGIAIGTMGGVLSGLFSTGGPPVVLYLSGIISDKHIYFATIQGYFAITDLYGMGTRIFSGIITWQVLLYAAIGWIGSLIGNTLGGLVFNKINGQSLKKIIYIGMIISGMIMILKELLR